MKLADLKLDTVYCATRGEYHNWQWTAEPVALVALGKWTPNRASRYNHADGFRLAESRQLTDVGALVVAYVGATTRNDAADGFDPATLRGLAAQCAANRNDKGVIPLVDLPEGYVLRIQPARGIHMLWAAHMEILEKRREQIRERSQRQEEARVAEEQARARIVEMIGEFRMPRSAVELEALLSRRPADVS